jgi:alkanesulfonate monooxygenase SsuD/methylene tetrahydromethanopterin reductase-like flavin-dependent oxidoreductase (luciferase family)
MELGAHLPLMEFGGEGQSLARIRGAAVAARECGFAAVSANDHFVFSTPWLDGPTALATVIEETAPLELATTVSLVALRGPVPLAKSLAAIDLLSGGRLVAGVGPGSSERDYAAVGIAFEDRWARFEEAVVLLRQLLPGFRRRPAPRCPARRRVARLGLQHDPRQVRPSEGKPRRRAPRPRACQRSLPEWPRHDVDLDHRGSCGRRQNAARRARAASWARCRPALGTGLRRWPGALPRVARTIR